MLKDIIYINLTAEKKQNLIKEIENFISFNLKQANNNWVDGHVVFEELNLLVYGTLEIDLKDIYNESILTRHDVLNIIDDLVYNEDLRNLQFFIKNASLDDGIYYWLTDMDGDLRAIKLQDVDNIARDFLAQLKALEV